MSNWNTPYTDRERRRAFFKAFHSAHQWNVAKTLWDNAQNEFRDALYMASQKGIVFSGSAHLFQQVVYNHWRVPDEQCKALFQAAHLDSFKMECLPHDDELKMYTWACSFPSPSKTSHLIRFDYEREAHLDEPNWRIYFALLSNAEEPHLPSVMLSFEPYVEPIPAHLIKPFLIISYENVLSAAKSRECIMTPPALWDETIKQIMKG